MKSAFLKDQALLEDIAAARREGRARLWWLGQSGFLVVVNGHSILLDPYLSDSLTRKYAHTDKPHVRITERVIAPEALSVDIVTSSHNHTDHFDPETLLPLLRQNPACRLVVPRANRHLALERLGDVADRLVDIEAGEHVTLGGAQLTAIPAAHNTVERDERGRHRFLCYLLRVGGLTLFHSGDTLLHEGLVASLRDVRIDVALLPINGNKPERKVAGNMDGPEAARFAKQAGARLAVPHHFDMFEFNTVSPTAFEEACRAAGQAFRTLRNGEGLDL